MNERPSSFRQRNGLASETPFRGGPIFNVPKPIGSIVLWNIALFVASFVISSPFGDYPIFLDAALIPIRLLAFMEEGRVLAAILPLFTHMFLHGDILHLGLNMAWLVVFGSGIARRLCITGTDTAESRHNVAVFFAFYIACGLAGGLTHLAVHPLDQIPMIGASGAISGLMGGTLRFALRLFAPYGAEYGALAPPTARPVLTASALYIGLNIGTGIVGSAGIEEAAQVAWEAHVGGFLFGLLAFPLFDRMAKRPPLPFGFTV